MHAFKDVNGDEWRISLNIQTVKDLREAVGVDLNALDNETFEGLLTDDEKLVDVVSWICTSQIESKGLSEIEFAQCLQGDVLDEAYDALFAELVFISRRRKKEALAAAKKTADRTVKRASEKIRNALEGGQIDKIIDQAIDKKVNEILEAFGT